VTGDLARSGEPERRYQELRFRVQQRHAALTRIEEAGDETGSGTDHGTGGGDHDERDEAVDLLVEAVDEWLAFTDRLPVLHDLPARAVSVQVVRASALAAGLGVTILGLGIWRGALGWGWLPVLLVVLVAVLRLGTLRVAPATEGHRRQRYTAAVCGGAALLVGPVTVLAGWPFGLLCAVLHLVAFGLVLELFGLTRPVRGRL
jgi:hypothetical protein